LDELGEIMPQPDKERKKVNQAGYDNADTEPFSGNYQQLYRELLEENRTLKEKFEEYTELIQVLHALTERVDSGDELFEEHTELIRELHALTERDDDGEEKYEDFAV
jgi:hypothetical protein